jgi:putative ABC transport system substrate-binding protein
MHRREFITLLGGAAASWPLAARAQQPQLPVIGLLSTSSPDRFAAQLTAFRQGLGEAGYVEGRNVAIEYHWAENDLDRLPGLAADLVRRHVDVIAAIGGLPSPLAAKAATKTIPIVFTTGTDPVAAGLVASLNRPGGNLTGVTLLNVEVGPKRLELLHELVPAAKIVAGLNPQPIDNAGVTSIEADTEAAARTLGLTLHQLRADSDRELDAAFVALGQLRVQALYISTSPFFTSRRKELAALTLRDAVPAAYQGRDFVAAGGLMSLGGNIVEPYRVVGLYVGRVLKGEKPVDLPVQQTTKIELFVNLRTAKALGLTVPQSFLLRADEVIE